MTRKRWRRWLNAIAQPEPRPPVALRPRRLRARLRLEELELRLAPACSIGVVAGVLTVNCDNAVNTVTVDHAGSITSVNREPFADASFTAIRINTGTGGDTVNLSATPAKPTTVQEVPGGSVTVRVSPVARNLDTIQGPVTVNAGADLSSLEINDQAHAGNTIYTLTATSVSRPGAATITYGAIHFVTVHGGSGANTYNLTNTGALNRTTLNTGNGSDTVNVTATASGRPLTVNGGTGGVAVNFSPTARNLDAIRGAVAVNGNSAGSNSLTLNDQANTASNSFTLTSSSVSRSQGVISFNNLIHTLTVNGGNGINSYFISGTGASNLTTLNTGNLQTFVTIVATSPSRALAVRMGSANDSVSVSLDTLRAPVTVTGSSGNSFLSVDDSLHTANTTYTVTASTVSRPGAATVTYSAIPNVTVSGGSGNDTYNVVNTGALHLTTLNPGRDGNNVVNVEATSPGRPLLINTNTDRDTAFNISPTARNLDTIQSTVTVVTHYFGDTNLVVSDQANTANATYTADFSSGIGRLGTASIAVFQDPDPFFRGGVRTSLNTGNGHEVINVERNNFNAFTINGGTGGVAVNLSPTTHDLDGVGVTVNGNSAGFNSLTLNDQAYSANATFTLTDSSVSRRSVSFTDGYVFNNLTTLTINGGTGPAGNTFNVRNTPANTAVTIHAGGRNDTIHVGDTGHTLDGILGPLTVDGQTGTDTLDIDDVGTLLPQSYRDDGHGTFQRLRGGPTIRYQSVEHRVLHPSAGIHHNGPGPSGSVVDILGTAAEDQVEIDAAGDTTVNVGNDQTGLDDLQGPVALLAQGKEDDRVQLNVNDQMTAAGQQYTLAQGGVTRSGAAPVSFAGIQAVVLNGGGGGNLFDVEGVSPGTPATINTGLGDNLVRMRQHDLINDALALNGQGKSDRLGYVAYTTDVYVNLQTGMATDIASFTGIRNLTGGGGNTILVGDGTQDSLTGGSGRNLLISGGGTGTLTGGGAGDILIGGSTAYDQDPDSLRAILAYWAGSADDYPTRVQNLRLGKGVPQLEAEVTVFGGGAANTLTGQGDEKQGVLNLFYVTAAGTITDPQPSEVVVILDGGDAPHGGGAPSRSRPGTPRAGAVPNEWSRPPSPAARATPQDSATRWVSSCAAPGSPLPARRRWPWI